MGILVKMEELKALKTHVYNIPTEQQNQQGLSYHYPRA